MRAELLVLLIFLPMLAEAWRARLNERAQRARGGIEPPGDVYGVMALAYPCAFLAMIGEGLARGSVSAFGFPVGALPAAALCGAVVFAAAKALKWWAIATLGRAWTFRVIVVPGDTLVASGPYRVVPHPNYVAVAGELVGAALMSGALIAGPIGTLAFIGLMVKRVAVERAALDAILAPTGVGRPT